jgi:hypothetical protein
MKIPFILWTFSAAVGNRPAVLKHSSLQYRDKPCQLVNTTSSVGLLHRHHFTLFGKVIFVFSKSIRSFMRWKLCVIFYHDRH